LHFEQYKNTRFACAAGRRADTIFFGVYSAIFGLI
jgi:hypothetical protein